MKTNSTIRRFFSILLAVVLVVIAPAFSFTGTGDSQGAAYAAQVVKITPEAVKQQLNAMEAYNEQLQEARGYEDSINILNQMEATATNLYALDQSNALGCEAMLDAIRIKRINVQSLIEFERQLQSKLEEYLNIEEGFPGDILVKSSGALLTAGDLQVTVQDFYNILKNDYRYSSLRNIIPEVLDDDELAEMLEELKDMEAEDDQLYEQVNEYISDMRDSLEKYEAVEAGGTVEADPVINRIDISTSSMNLTSKLSELKLSCGSDAYSASVVAIGSDMVVYYKDGDKKYPGKMPVADLYRDGNTAYVTVVIRVVPKNGYSFGKGVVCYAGGNKCSYYGTKKEYTWDAKASSYPDTVRYYAFDSFKIVNKYDISKTTVSLASKTYTGKAITQVPTVKVGKTTLKANTHFTYKISNNKSIGQAKVVITGKGSGFGSKTAYFNIVPKGTSLSSLTAASKGFTAKWKAQKTQTTGYQVQYGLKSDFSDAKTVTISKNSTVSKKITKLKAKKKYYVRVRTYKTVSGKKYYSSWSTKKTVTTKK